MNRGDHTATVQKTQEMLLPNGITIIKNEYGAYSFSGSDTDLTFEDAFDMMFDYALSMDSRMKTAVRYLTNGLSQQT